MFTRPTYPVNNIRSQATILEYQEEQLKATFDKVGEDTKNYISNTFLPELESATGSTNIGTPTITGITGATIAEQLSSIKQYNDSTLNAHKTSADHDARYRTKIEQIASDQQYNLEIQRLDTKIDSIVLGSFPNAVLQSEFQPVKSDVANIKLQLPNKLDVGATSANSTKWNGWQTFYTLTQLGLSETTTTIQQLFNALPAKSMYVGATGTLPTAEFPKPYTALIVTKISGYYCVFQMFVPQQSGETSCYYGTYSEGTTPNFSGWKTSYDSGNYGRRKFISGNYTLTNEDHGKILCVNDSLGSTNITVFIPTGLKENFECGFIERFVGSGNSIFSPLSGVGLFSVPDNKKFKTSGNSAHVYIELRDGNNVSINGDLKE